MLKCNKNIFDDVTLWYSIDMFQGRIQDYFIFFLGGGGGGATQKIICAHAVLTAKPKFI